ncbi:UvrABC system protein C [Clostridia bacterium]|nr:UvrABC system protein C [Clostridia bacterium]
MFNIEEELKKLPQKPGVYLMHDRHDEIIYVGKAINLKNRVRQYFQSSRGKTSKIQQMISRIVYFEYIITDSELEALVLECNLIKEHRPRYNTLLKDDKGYPYIQVSISEPYPRIRMARSMKKDKNKYFGPYTSIRAVKNTIELINKIYHLRSCNRNLPRDIGKERPCLDYHMKLCDAPCQAYISQEDYHALVKKALEFLQGKMDFVLEDLEQKMLRSSEQLDFEQAAIYRDLLESVRLISQRQKVISSSLEDRDIIGFAREGADAVVQVFFIREGKLIGREHFHLTIDQEEEDASLLKQFFLQFYSGTPFIPKEIFSQEKPAETDILLEWLESRREQKVKIIIPQKGEKSRLVELAQKNAELLLSKDKERIKREEKRTIGAVKQIADLLGLDHINRMEAFDISNISGFQAVGSMVVYEKGKPKRNDYRKFKIKSVEGPNDYASMEEVLTRRFEHGQKEEKKNSFTCFPDLLLMDGGKGQVNIALAVLEKLGLTIPVCGMVKDDSHRTRGLYYQNKELPLSTHSEGFHLITRIQDEAHRFAIEYHRNLRSKTQIHSILDDIEDIGEIRRKALMKTFASLEKIKAATIEELQNVPGMNEKSAKSVYQFFHQK